MTSVDLLVWMAGVGVLLALIFVPWGLWVRRREVHRREAQLLIGLLKQVK